jgi:histone-lysine N-methyltransferase SETMAR
LAPSCYIRECPRGGIGSWKSKKEIKPGEELTFDYGNASGSGLIGGESRAAREGDEGNDACVTDRRTRCMCNAPNCRGYMPFDETL